MEFDKMIQVSFRRENTKNTKDRPNRLPHGVSRAAPFTTASSTPGPWPSRTRVSVLLREPLPSTLGCGPGWSRSPGYRAQHVGTGPLHSWCSPLSPSGSSFGVVGMKFTPTLSCKYGHMTRAWRTSPRGMSPRPGQRVEHEA